MNSLTGLPGSILDHAAYTIISAAPDGLITSFNPAAERLLGYSAAEMIGKQTPACFHDPDEIVRRAAQFSTELGEHIAPGFEVFAARARRDLPNEYEWTLIRKDGSRVPVLVSVAALRDENGQITGYMGICSDLTERKRVEQALRESERRYQTLAEVSPVGIFRTDAQGQTVYVNPRWCKIAGMAAEEAMGEGWAKAVHPQEREEIIAGWQEAVRIHNPSSAEYRFLQPDGTVTWVLGQALPEKDGAGKIVGYVGTITDVTERKRSEATLRENEERLRLALAAANQGLFDLDLRTGKAIVSPEYARMVGYEPGEMEFTTEWWRDHLHPQDRGEVLRVLEECVQGRRHEHRLEYRLRTKSGEWKWILSLGKVVEFGPQGRPARLLGTHTDISERKHAEAVVRESERRFRSLVQNASAVIFILDPQGVFRLSEGLGLAHLGLKPGQVVGQSAFALYKDIPSVVDSIRRALNGELTRSVNEVGKVVFDTVYSPSYDANGLVNGVVGIAIDITERMRAETALREREAKLASIFRAAPVGIGVVKDRVFQEVNDAMCEITGYSRGELLGRKSRLIYPSDREFDRVGREKYAEIAQSGTGTIETVWQRKDRANIQVLLSSTPLDPSDPGKGVTFTALDITRRKRSEQELQRKNEELERFTYTVSHDLKSPLITVQGFASTLTRDFVQGRHEHMEADLRRIISAADRMSELLNGLLELSRIGRIVNPQSNVAMIEVGREVLELLAGPIKQRHARVSVQADLPVVRGDRRRLVEVVQNLVENALKFSSNRTRPHVEFGLTQTEAGPTFYVRDNGVGINPKYLEKVFGLFDKLNSRTEGTGIGLALVRRIIEFHGGRIWAVSEGEGHGTTFYFTLPISTDVAPVCPPQPALTP